MPASAGWVWSPSEPKETGREIAIMQLNSSGSGSSLQSEINITPLVDVVLVLLIIFMVVVPLLLQGYDVGIPKTSAEAVPAQAEEVQVVLSIELTACRILAPPAGEGLPAHRPP